MKITDHEKDMVVRETSPFVAIEMNSSIYTTPIFANGVLFVTNRDHLFAIRPCNEP